MYLHDLGIINALGSDKASVANAIFSGSTSAMVLSDQWLTDGSSARVGAIASDVILPNLDKLIRIHHRSRNNQVLLHAFLQVQATYTQLIKDVPPHRIGIVLGTSTSGVAESERAFRALQSEGPDAVPEFHYTQQEPASPAQFLAEYLQVKGPCYAISTACTSSAFALISARNLIDSGLCDVVITGGVDTLCRLTINGFTALESTTSRPTNPMSVNRCGINIGEGAAIFLMSKTPASNALIGFGESNDAYHISAPDPSGIGAIHAMQSALRMAGIAANEIDYVNLHATGTVKNDEMESVAMHTVFPHGVLCSGTKPLIGHTLGASSAQELAMCWLMASPFNEQGALLPHIYDGDNDPNLPALNLVSLNQKMHQKSQYIWMSNSFAFGGSNVSLVMQSTPFGY